MPEKKPVARSAGLVAEETSAAASPSHEEIATLAYALWEARGRGDGLAEQDWIEAERQLRKPRAEVQAA